MRHREGMLDQSLDLPEADGQRDGISVLSKVIHQLLSPALLGIASLENEIEHAAGSELSIRAEHLPMSQRLLRKALRAGILDARHFGMVREELRHALRRLLHVGHAG